MMPRVPEQQPAPLAPTPSDRDGDGWRDFLFSAVVRPVMLVFWCAVFWGTFLWLAFAWRAAREGWRAAAARLLHPGTGGAYTYLNAASCVLALVTWGLVGFMLVQSRRRP
jgi:hypothetical protein